PKNGVSFLDRVEMSVPLYVNHPDESALPQGWNEGAGNNLGGIITATNKLTDNINTNFYLGAMGGAYKNSVYEQSILAGGVVGVDHHVGKGVHARAEVVAGAISGYKNDPDKFIPALGVRGSLSRTFNARSIGEVEVGIKATWLPSKTAEKMAYGRATEGNSDAYVVEAMIAKRF
ncbi:MAG: hypothetical protein KTR28_06190, partial [Micavibrio sp.]|nr:hypothetical protein [Micavibrio sp.]